MSELWKARLLPGSWRGIPFFIDSHQLQGGRHAVLHEPPDRDSNHAEDIGKQSKRYSLECHVIGDTYFFIRDALIKAMDEEGRGVLVHPYLGIKQVQPIGYTILEDSLEGRICRISFECSEAGDPSFPFAAIDALTDIATTIVATVAQVKNGFQLAFKIAELPAFAVESAEAVVTDFINSVKSGFKNVRLDGTQHAELTRSLDDMEANKAVLVRNPASLANEVDGVVSGLNLLVLDAPESTTVDATSGRDDKLAVFNNLIVFEGAAETFNTTPTRIQEQTNAEALNDMIQQLSIARLSEATVDKEFKSIEESVAQREIVTENIVIQLNKTQITDEVFQEFEDLNAKLANAVPNKNSQLSNTKAVTNINSKPSIVMAYDLYESLDNEQDIIDRNKVRHPGFVNGKLKVLVS